MFKHILVSTDGSKLSAKAVRMAVQLAKSTGASLTGITVVAPYFPPMYGEAAAALPVVSAATYKREVEAHAKRVLDKVTAIAPGMDVRTRSVTGGEPWKAIVAAARKGKCDLIVMASHGRSGLSGLLLGSETTKVLTHSKIPVLVCR